MRGREAGFTLIEMAATVAVIGILAAIAIPSFFGETRKARAAAEVTPMFSDLRIFMERYLQERGVYPDTLGEGGLQPTANPDATLHPLQPPPTTWQGLNIRFSGPDAVRCGYTWVTSRSSGGTVGPTKANAGNEGKNVFGFAAPDNDWYYLLAKCRMDSNHTTFSWYFTSSLDSAIKKDNEGQ